jgi:hypothetical protein
MNVGITAFEIRSMPAMPLVYEAYLEVQNYGFEASEVTITLASGPQRISRKAMLQAGESFRGTIDLSSFAGGAVRAEIQAGNDALASDDVAFAYLPVKRTARTLLVTRGNQYLETLLKLNPYVELMTVAPANYHESQDADVYIFDRFAPPAPPAGPALVLGTPNVPWLRPAKGSIREPSITTWRDDHPVMQYVSVHDIKIERASWIDASNLMVIAAAGDLPLIVASHNPRWLMLTFDLESSDFPFHVGFPVFMDNVLGWFSREQLAVHRPLGIVEIPLANAQIQAMDGKPVPSEQRTGTTVFSAATPGLYMAVAGDERIHIAVNLANPAFSNVNQSIFSDNTAAASQRFPLRRELWFYMLLAAVVLISVEWFTYHRRITL